MLRTIRLMILKFKPTVRETVVSLTRSLALLRLRNVAAIQEQFRKKTITQSRDKWLGTIVLRTVTQSKVHVQLEADLGRQVTGPGRWADPDIAWSGRAGASFHCLSGLCTMDHGVIASGAA
ncbi:hypothetical protein T4D_11569 [Trichinella pseudospiralis]|uniref:Uncharacterized protein n=1 Tax=Trichinella pseudospiralis TaxID=6337 RepID=A0A0V1G444_TRIPS|nr:hypothetical protein T4D_11569 [Trichinella pseudospiralis]